MFSKRGMAASIATIWLAVWASAPFAAVHVLTHHQDLHHEDSAEAGHHVGFDHARGHDHDEGHSHPTLRLTSSTSPRPPVVRDAVALDLPVASVVVEVAPHRTVVCGRNYERPPALHTSISTIVLRI